MKNKILVSAVALVAVVVGAVYYFNQDSIKPPPLTTTPSGITTPPASTTHLPVPPNIKVPEIGEKPADENIAVPVSVTPSAPGVETKLRTYNIKGENNVFEPSTLLANVGDTIHINFTAVDKTYDITVPDYGLKQTAMKGETKILEFQAVNEGQYLYYCTLCGGETSSAKGYMIISKKQ